MNESLRLPLIPRVLAGVSSLKNRLNCLRLLSGDANKSNSKPNTQRYAPKTPHRLPQMSAVLVPLRNDPLEPDWLRIGTDIVGGGKTLNAAFSLDGSPVPEPATNGLMGVGLLALALFVRNRHRRITQVAA